MHFDPSRLDAREAWPELPYAEWRPTLQTVHRWVQIVGKIRMVLSTPMNHYWHVPLYVAARGLTTSVIHVNGGTLEMTFDFVDHQLHIRTDHGGYKSVPLVPRSVASFYREVTAALHALGIAFEIRAWPDEVEDRTRFAEDHHHASYDPVAMERFWRALCTVDALLRVERGRFIGKASPVHFFWGSFDLALSFFSGRKAPARPGADAITREAYSHEVISLGFWPGDERMKEACLYGYAVPAPEGFSELRLRPGAAYYSEALGEFLLPWDALRREPSPSRAVLAFCDDVLEGGMRLGRWDREALLRSEEESEEIFEGEAHPPTT